MITQRSFLGVLSSAPLRIPDTTHGWLWLKPNSLLAGEPIYIVDEERTKRLVPLERDQGLLWAYAEAWHNAREKVAA